MAGHAWKDAEDGGRENDRGGTVVDLFFFQELCLVDGHDLDPTVLDTVAHWEEGSVFHGKGEEKAGTPWVRPGNLTFTPQGCPARGPPLSFPLSPGAFSPGGSLSWAGNREVRPPRHTVE